MPCKKVTGKEIYSFCLNSPYYETLLKHVKDKKSDVEKEEKCNNLTTSMTSFNNENAKDICQNFKFLYKSFSTSSGGRTSKNDIFTDYDCNFLNYWLNKKLREKVTDDSINVKEFYEKIKEQDTTVFSDHEELGHYMHVIDLDIFENMKYLYDLYDNTRNILNMMRGQDYQDDLKTNEERKSCSDYTEDCSKKYMKAMDKCLNGNADFYNALKDFKISYNIAVEQEPQNLNNCKSSQYFHLPNYDPVLEKQRNIIAGKILSAPLILSFVIPLLYKYTPLGPFLRKKINIVKNRWINSDEYGNELSSLPTDIEDNISDNEEYNIGYYSETNY
ncbi:PIR Superfamily Protein [Plasmodium ovale wallikeri]|uniref:PIR Superfamily Protein n=1 Tax=Plasmodium ovale wallikeri TaxID=864142 RepID=A0A1A9ALR8_PLAOA|nr:PIR Superfamily Protein [Plasmodium ovale wallikeri]SBT59172.1 PIR Superfamily Protein [Plasmodium ovale wallikeri]